MSPLEKFAMIRKMPIGELLAKLGQKTGQFAVGTGKMVAENPGKSAAVAGLGGLAAHEMQEDPEAEMEEELLRAYGIR